MIDLGCPDVIFAVNAVRQAATLAKLIQAELVSPAITKDDKSPVTVADFASQALVGGLLDEVFPQDILVAEESSAMLRQPGEYTTLLQITGYVSRRIRSATIDSVCKWIDKGMAEPEKRCWVLDPIDGTKGFLRGDQYVVALALIENNVVQLGVLGCPNLVDGRKADFGGAGSLVIAQRGRGTWVTSLNEKSAYSQLIVSDISSTVDARILRSFEDSHTNTLQIDGLAQELGTQATPVRLDSQAKYAMLASGMGDLALRMLSSARPDYREKIWDQAAGSIIVEEAGGRITDLDGKLFDFSQGRSLNANRGVLASNGHLHETVLRALKAVEAHD